MKSLLQDNNIRVLILLLILVPPLASRLAVPGLAAAQNGPDPYHDLQRTIEDALAASLELESAQEEILAAESQSKARKSEFFPIFSLGYQYTRSDDDQEASEIGIIRPKNEYALSMKLTQPVFAGFENYNLYKVSEYALAADRLAKEIVRLEIVLRAKNVYFSLLKAAKILGVAQETVAQIESQKEVAENYYKVGMTPLNDLLQVEVELANAKQQLIVAKNEVETAEAAFNTLLRRPINAPVVLEDITAYEPFEYDIELCLGLAEKERKEIEIADLELQIAEKLFNVAKSSYYPSVDLQWNYRQQGEEWDARGGLGAFGDGSVWDVTAIATWDVLEWGRSYYRAEEEVHRVAQARLRRTRLLDDIRLQVKTAFLKMRESEKNIKTVELAIEQAKENYRIFAERYKEQVVTQTDVLIAQTLLSRTQTNYYNALYDYKRAKAALLRAMGIFDPPEKTRK